MDNSKGLRTKKFCISSKKGQVSNKTMLNEIAKCDILCANCHRIKTIGEM